jgi:MFS family permease
VNSIAAVSTVSHYFGNTFRSLRHRNYRLFFFGQLISLIGTWLQNTALSWLVYSITHDARSLGLIAFIGSAPILFLSIYAGTVADEFPKRRIVIITQTASGLLAVALSVVIWTHHTSVPIIAVISFLLGVVNAFDIPSRQAFVVEMTNKEDLPNAVALNSAIFNAARLVGPAVGAEIIYLSSIPMCFFLNGVSYIAVIIGLLMMKFKMEVTHKRSADVSRYGAMKVGLEYLWGVKQLRALMGLVVAMTLFGWTYSVNLPVVAGELLKGDARTFGRLLSANGLGALLAALSQAGLSSRFDARRTVFVAIAVFIVSILTIALVHSYAVILIALVGCGWGIITFFITANTVFQRRVPDELRGRIMGIYSLFSAGLIPVGSLLAGILAHGVGVATAYGINAGILFALSFPIFFYLNKLPRLSKVSEAERIEELMTSEVVVTQAEQIAKG